MEVLAVGSVLVKSVVGQIVFEQLFGTDLQQDGSHDEPTVSQNSSEAQQAGLARGRTEFSQYAKTIRGQ